MMVTKVTFGPSTYRATMMDDVDKEPYGFISVGCSHDICNYG